MGLGKGYIHPFDTLKENSGRLLGLGRDIYRGDFSKISDASRHDMANFACARAGEVVGMVAAGYSIAKIIPGLVVGGTRMVANVLGRGCVKNTCTGMVESRVAIAAEARVATAGETAVASENASGIATRIGRPSKPIWSKTKKFTSVENALNHWKDHGKEFPGIQNSKQYVENAWKFRDRTDVLIKVRTNGERVLYDHPNNTFGVFTKTGRAFSL